MTQVSWLRTQDTKAQLRDEEQVKAAQAKTGYSKQMNMKNSWKPNWNGTTGSLLACKWVGIYTVLGTINEGAQNRWAWRNQITGKAGRVGVIAA